MQLGNIKKEFGLKEINIIELGPIYKNLDGIPVEILYQCSRLNLLIEK